MKTSTTAVTLIMTAIVIGRVEASAQTTQGNTPAAHAKSGNALERTKCEMLSDDEERIECEKAKVIAKAPKRTKSGTPPAVIFPPDLTKIPGLVNKRLKF